MGKLKGWETRNERVDEGAKFLSMLILDEKDRLSRPCPDGCFVSAGSSSSFSSSDLDESEDNDENLCGSADSSDGPLYELSELLLQLPIKRGLSKYYQGQSRSFKNLGNVKNVKEFAKETSSKGSSTKSYTTTPKHIICKKSSSSRHHFLADKENKKIV